MDLYLYQTHQVIGDFKACLEEIQATIKLDGLHIFPEMYLTGYPIKDLAVQRLFIEKYLHFLNQINEWSKSLNENQNCVLLLGGLQYEFDEDGLPKIIENGVFRLTPGKSLEFIYAKKLLPNYDIFDEKKYFRAGEKTTVLEHQNQKFGIMICEDMWTGHLHDRNPRKELFDYCQKNSLKLDGIINLSASPFTHIKHKKRKERAAEIISHFGCPFYYVNRVGAEDDILFDGGSFILDQDYNLTHQAPFFKKDIIKIKTTETAKAIEKVSYQEMKGIKNSWKDLFAPRLDDQGKIIPFTDDQCELILEALKFGLQDYARKNGFKKFLIALSGGLDSALVLAIAKLSLQKDQELEAIYMPSIFSSTLSRELSELAAEKAQIRLKHFPIKFLHSTLNNAFMQNFLKPLKGLANENVQSRLRGLLLYSRSNQTSAMVINTSNKSELAVGYSTLYGDSVGALSLLGDLYKTDVYRLSEYINKKYNDLIPVGIITRSPTAELRDDQTDLQSLPPYHVLDSILEGFLSYNLGPSELLDYGYSQTDIDLTLKLYQNSEFKRYQFPPILKITPKSFGFGYRIPISKV